MIRCVMPAMVARCFVVLALGTVACGNDSGSSGARGGLGEARYKQLDALYVASSDFDEREDEKSVRTACESLDSAAPVTATQRRMCALTLKLLRRSDDFALCLARPMEPCPASQDPRGVPDDLLTAARKADAAIAAAGLTDDCADALRSRAVDRKAMEDLGRGFKLLLRGARAGSERALRRAAEILREVDASILTEVKSFRDGCG